MKLWKKGAALFLSASMMASSFAGTAFAETRTKISSIKLNVESSIEVGGDSSDVSVTTDANNYSIDEVEVTNDDGDWENGDAPRIKVTLIANDDYYFSTTSSSAFRFTGDADVDSVSASRKDSNSTLVATLKLDELIGSLGVDSAQWQDDDSPIAEWEEADGAKSYQVRLYRGSSSVTELITTTNTYYNFSSNITRTGEYSFRVRAIDKNSKKGDWTESDTFDVEDNELRYIQSGNYNYVTNTNTSGNGNGNGPGSNNAQSGTWLQDGVGWWYRNADGSYTKSGWQVINNLWYCFNDVGYMRTGWIYWNNLWYYCDVTTGAMLSNTRTPDGYTVNSSGVWVQ